MSDISQQLGIVERAQMMRGFLHRFTRRAPLLAEHRNGPRACVNCKTGERIIEATAEQAAEEEQAKVEIRARIEQRTRELVNEAIERAAQKGAEERADVVAPPAGPLICEVLDIVTRVTGVSSQELIGPRRQRPASEARHLAFWLLVKVRPDLSLPAIGRAMKRDHTSIMYGRDRVEENQADEPFAGWLAHDAIVQLMNLGGTP